MAKKLQTNIAKSERSKEGKRLFALRKKHGWTQKELAEKFGVTPDTIVKWEMGTRNMSGPAMKLLEVFEGTEQ